MEDGGSREKTTKGAGLRRSIGEGVNEKALGKSRKGGPVEDKGMLYLKLMRVGVSIGRRDVLRCLDGSSQFCSREPNGCECEICSSTFLLCARVVVS